MNEGGKVVFAGRNGWVQQTSTGTGAATRYSGLHAGGRSPCTASTTRRPGGRRRPSAHGVLPRAGHLQRLGPVVARRRRRARAAWARPRYNAARGEPGSGRVPRRGWRPIALDTSRGLRRHAGADAERGHGRGRAAAKAPTRLRTISSVDGASGRSARSGSRPTTPASRTPTAAAIVSTRDSVSIGLRPGADHRPGARNELVRRMMGYLLPTTADTAAPTVTWLRPGDGRDGQRRRPGGDRGRGRRRARRPQGGPPERRRHAGRARRSPSRSRCAGSRPPTTSATR